MLLEYAFMPWQTIEVEVEGKGAVMYEKMIRGPANPRAIYFLKVHILGIYDEPELPEAKWNDIRRGDKVMVRYRFSRYHNLFRHGRELQTKFVE